MIRNITLPEGYTIPLEGTSGPISGTCPLCGAKMHARTSVLGTRYAALNNGEEHTNPLCRRMDQLKRTPDMAKTDFESLVPRLLREKHARGASSDNNDHPTVPASPPKKSDIIPIGSLSAVQDSGILSLSPFQKINDGNILSSYLMRPSWLENAKKFNVPMTGNKIVECFYGGVKEEINSVYFNMTWPHAGGGKYHAHFQLRGNDEIFAEFVSKYCTYIKNEYGRAELKFKADPHMLIAGTWDRIPCDPIPCRNNKRWGCETCLGLFTSPLTNLAQCYVMRQGGEKDE